MKLTHPKDWYDSAIPKEGCDIGGEGMRWIPADEMHNQPMGWYWAGFPGGWLFYRADRGTLAIFHGGLEWHESLNSKFYFGPWTPPIHPPL